MPNAHDAPFVDLLNQIAPVNSCRQSLERLFRRAYCVLGPARAAAIGRYGRAATDDATQNALREFLEKLRRGDVIPERAPGLLRVMFWRRLLDERRRIARSQLSPDPDSLA